jgi:hypothetical protein
MGFRFRKRISIAPGVRLNFSKGGASWSLGRRGASLNVGKRGKRMTVGLPGTGMSYSKSIGKAAPGSAKRSGSGANLLAGLVILGIIWFLVAHFG